MADTFTFRFRVFVDFWNFQLYIRDLDSDLRVDWKKLPHVLIAQSLGIIDADARAQYQGMGVYMSYAPGKDSDRKLKGWAGNVLDKMPGTSVVMLERRKLKSPPSCPSCHSEVPNCPICDHDMRGSREKGVDTRIATDMIRLAWEGAYDVALLVSSDADFVPVVEFLDTKNVKVIHVGVGGQGHHLMQKCWGAVRLEDFIEDIRRKVK